MPATVYVGGLQADRQVYVNDIDDPVGGATNSDYKEVTVVVSWIESGSWKSYDFVTYIAP